MKKSFKKAIAVLLAVLMVAFSVPFTALAAPGDYNPNINLYFGTASNFVGTGLLAGDGAYAESAVKSTEIQDSMEFAGLFGVPVDYDKKAGTLTLKASKTEGLIEYVSGEDYEYEVEPMEEDYTYGVGDYFMVTVACENIDVVNVFSCKLKYSANIEPAGVYGYGTTAKRTYNFATLETIGAQKAVVQAAGEVVPGQCSDTIYTDINNIAGDLSEWDTDARVIRPLANAQGNHDCSVTAAPEGKVFFSPVDGSADYEYTNTLLTETYMFKIVGDGPIEFTMAEPVGGPDISFDGGYYIATQQDGTAVQNYTTYAPDTYEIEPGMTAKMTCEHGYWQGSCLETAKTQQGVGSCKMTFMGENEWVTSTPEPSHEHSYTSEVTKEATCVDDGVLTYTCSNADGNCDKVSYTEAIPATGIHTEATRDVNVKDSTCSAVGSKDVETYCTVCNTVISTEKGVEIAKKAHTSVDVDAVAPGCETAGSTAGTKCDVCGEILTGVTEVPATGHNYTGALTPATDKTHTVACVNDCGTTETKDCSFVKTVVTPATPVSEGTARFTCACGNTYDEVIPKTDCTHNGATTTVGAVEATCSKEGYTGDTVCDICGETIATGTAITKLAHTEATRDENVVDATCSAAGSKDVVTYCSVCNEVLGTQNVEITKLAHTPEVIPAVPATCTATGLTAGEKCSVCGEVTVAQTETAKIAHTPEVIPAVAATCSATGLAAGEKCSVCGEVTVAQTETAKLPHTEATRENVIAEPDYENAGSKEVITYCSVCDEVIKTDVVAIPALEGGIKVTVSATDLGTTTLNGLDATNGLTKTVAKNSTVKIAAKAADGAEFIGWAVNGKVVSTSATYTVPAFADITYVPVFTDTAAQAFTVVFTDPYGNVISTQEVTTAADLIVPENVVRPGYTFIGWSVDPATVTEGTTIVAQFEKNEADAYTVTAAGCTIEANGTTATDAMENVAFDSKVTVTSEGATAWMANGSIVGYGESYTFFCGSDITLTPVTDAVTATPTVTAISKDLVTGSDYKVMFLASRTMTDDCKYVASGFIYGANVNTADLTLENVNNSSIRVAYSASSSEQFAVTSGIKSKTGTLSAVAFLVYVDATGAQVVDYATALTYDYSKNA